MQIKKMFKAFVSLCMALSLVVITDVKALDASNTFYIEGKEDTVYYSLQEAVDAAVDNDTIIVDGYSSMVHLDETVEIDKDLKFIFDLRRISCYDSIGSALKIVDATVQFDYLSISCYESATPSDVGNGEVYGVEMIDSTLYVTNFDLAYNDFDYFTTLENSTFNISINRYGDNVISGNVALMKDNQSFITFETNAYVLKDTVVATAAEDVVLQEHQVQSSAKTKLENGVITFESGMHIWGMDSGLSKYAFVFITGCTRDELSELYVKFDDGEFVWTDGYYQYDKSGTYTFKALIDGEEVVSDPQNVVVDGEIVREDIIIDNGELYAYYDEQYGHYKEYKICRPAADKLVIKLPKDVSFDDGPYASFDDGEENVILEPTIDKENNVYTYELGSKVGSLYFDSRVNDMFFGFEFYYGKPNSDGIILQDVLEPYVYYDEDYKINYVNLFYNSLYDTNGNAKEKDFVVKLYEIDENDEETLVATSTLSEAIISNTVGDELLNLLNAKNKFALYRIELTVNTTDNKSYTIPTRMFAINEFPELSFNEIDIAYGNAEWLEVYFGKGINRAESHSIKVIEGNISDLENFDGISDSGQVFVSPANSNKSTVVLEFTFNLVNGGTYVEEVVVNLNSEDNSSADEPMFGLYTTGWLSEGYFSVGTKLTLHDANELIDEKNLYCTFDGKTWSQNCTIELNDSVTYPAGYLGIKEGKTGKEYYNTQDLGFTIDKTAPTFVIQPSTSKPTNKDVVITLVAEDKEAGLAEVAYQFNEGPWTEANTFTVKENGKVSFKIRDAVANIVSGTFEITWIDKEAPKATASVYSVVDKNEEITYTVTFNEDVVEAASPTCTSSAGNCAVVLEKNVATITVTAPNTNATDVKVSAIHGITDKAGNEFKLESELLIGRTVAEPVENVVVKDETKLPTTITETTVVIEEKVISNLGLSEVITSDNDIKNLVTNLKSEEFAKKLAEGTIESKFVEKATTTNEVETEVNKLKSDEKVVKNVVAFDLSLVATIKVDDTKTADIKLTTATASDLVVYIPYPAGTSKDDTFVLLHKVEDEYIEETNIKNETKGIRVELSSFSPFILVTTETEEVTPPTPSKPSYSGGGSGSSYKDRTKTENFITVEGKMSSSSKFTLGEVKTNSNEYKLLDKEIKENEMLLNAFTIKLTDTSGNIKVSFPVDAKYEGKKVRIVRVTDETVKTYDATVTGGLVTFSTSTMEDTTYIAVVVKKDEVVSPTLDLSNYSDYKLDIFSNSRVTGVKASANGFTVNGYMWINNIKPSKDTWREIVFVNAEDADMSKAYRKSVTPVYNTFLNSNMTATQNGKLDLSYANYSVDVNPNSIENYTKTSVGKMAAGNYLVYMRISDGKNSYLFPLVDRALSDGSTMENTNTLPSGFSVADADSRTLVYTVK